MHFEEPIVSLNCNNIKSLNRTMKCLHLTQYVSLCNNFNTPHLFSNMLESLYILSKWHATLPRSL